MKLFLVAVYSWDVKISIALITLNEEANLPRTLESVMPLVREKSREDAGIYSVRIAEDYCLMWEAGAAGATIDYRIRVRPPEP